MNTKDTKGTEYLAYARDYIFEHGMHERNGIGSLTLVICGALKERYLKGQSVRAVIWIVIVY